MTVYTGTTGWGDLNPSLSRGYSATLLSQSTRTVRTFFRQMATINSGGPVIVRCLGLAFH